MRPFFLALQNVKTFNKKCEGVFKIRLRNFLFRLRVLLQVLKHSLQHDCSRDFTVSRFRDNE